MDYTALSQPASSLGPVPGLLPAWAPLVGWTNRRAARAFALRLVPVFDGWRSLDPLRARVELRLTLPVRLRRRATWREHSFRHWVSLAVRWAAGGLFPYGLARSAITITVDYAYGVPRWGEALVNVELSDQHE